MKQTSTVFLTCLAVVFLFNGCTQDAPEKDKKEKPEHLVEFVTLARTDLGVSISRTGSLKVLREVKIHTQEEGRITELPHHQGDKVVKGALIARLDDSLLRSQYHRAEAVLNKNIQDIRRMRDLFRRKLASDQEIANAETELAVAKADMEVLETRLGYTKIYSPVTGIVTQRITEPGNIAERYSHLLTIVDPTSLITEVSVSGLLLPELKVGDAAQVRIDALGASQFPGIITRIHPSLDPVTRRGIIEVGLNPVPAGALPGQLCRVKLDTHAGNRLVIPSRALRRDTEGEYVYVMDDDSRAQRIAVTSGLRISEQIEIISGLEEGQRVITRGFLSLKPGKQVKPVHVPGADKKPDQASADDKKPGKGKFNPAMTTSPGLF